MSRKGRMRRSFATLRNRAYLHAHDRTVLRSRIINSDRGTKVGHRKTRKSRRTERNGLRATRVVVESSLRNFFFSESERVCVHVYGMQRTRAYYRRRMTPCGSIISQKSDNWFINVFAAFNSLHCRLITAISDDRIWR